MEVSECLKNLAESDESAARAKALMKGLELKLKRVKAAAFLGASGTVSEREQRAYNSDEYKQTADAYEEAVLEYEILYNKRNTWQMGFSYWQSLNANRRMAGNV